MDSRYLVVCDLETTGLKSEKHEIIQIAREVVDLQTRERMADGAMNCFIKPGNRWSKRDPEAMEVNKLEAGYLEEYGVNLWEGLRQFSVGVPWNNASLASWGIDLEFSFLNAACAETLRPVPYNYRTVDIRGYAFIEQVKKFRDTEYKGLTAVCNDLEIPVITSMLHDARYDAWLASEVLITLLKSGAQYIMKGPNER